MRISKPAGDFASLLVDVISYRGASPNRGCLSRRTVEVPSAVTTGRSQPQQTLRPFVFATFLLDTTAERSLEYGLASVSHGRQHYNDCFSCEASLSAGRQTGLALESKAKTRVNAGGRNMKLIRAGLWISVLIFLAIGAWAQSSEGRLSGRVTDPTGAVLRNAQITIENVATGVKRVVETNSAGEYSASALEPGSYKISAEAAGFKTAISTPVLLEVSRDIRIDLQLQPGKVMETMEVSARRQLADTTTTTLNGVLSNKAINELPVQGGDFQNLLELHPGVQRTPGGGFHSVTSNGNRPDDNNFFIDGADDNDAYYGETVVNDAGISGTPASFLPLDAIQEFNTQESPSADYGVKPGVVMNIGIKSGTNNIHGSAYYFNRNVAYDARNYFDPAPSPESALNMNEFGVSIGGPIKKDKWFYFVNYQGIRDKVGNPGLTDSPVTASLADQMGGIANPDGSPLSAEFSVPDAIAYFNDPNNVAYCLANTYGDLYSEPPQRAFVAIVSTKPGIHVDAI